jgi:methionine-rich copper-binding protein CopC
VIRPFYVPVKSLLAAAIGLGLLCLSTGLVFAAPSLPTHASVWKSDPAIGSTIASAPTQVTVFALESIKPQGSSLQVYGPGPDATDTLINRGTTRFPLSDSKQMSIAIAPLSAHANGVYIVVWQTVSADDGDPDSGSFAFTVGRSANSASTPVITRGATPAAPGASTGLPLWVSISAALVALGAGLGIGLGLGRRSRLATTSLGAMRASIVQTREEEEAGKRP